jgi:hypothetical protein
MQAATSVKFKMLVVPSQFILMDNAARTTKNKTTHEAFPVSTAWHSLYKQVCMCSFGSTLLDF